MTICDPNRRSLCPIDFTLTMLGDKWSLLLVRDLAFFGSKSYSDFLKSEEGISTNILADRLKSLQANDIITKSTDTDNKRKSVYQLSTKGIEIVPILIEMIRWAGKYDPQTAAPKEFLERLDTDTNEVIQEIKQSILSQKIPNI
ncbi:Transcriptional regulator, HxlR family [hydrothermal vent metagenome]|uniref:Transcriptional regulator, HxlR family n=1 Tax=hydrothermal vent metagenome TaxID=652676 RepID=A0A3B0YGQ6_9ZZZZ